MRLRHPRLAIGVTAGVGAVIAFLLLPLVHFDVSYSAVLLDRQGRLLDATIAADEQWRFPPRAAVPPKFAAAIRAFEDRRFDWHPGVDPVAVVRAAVQNLRAGRVESGASTLTMQVVRLSRPHRPRSVVEKGIEAALATRLEAARTKEEILALYAAHAPFGGNVVGLEAAAWRYFGRPADELSWAEAATLAVLPNSPALIHPGRNRDRLRHKRDCLLDRLLEEGVVDAETCHLAQREPLPAAPLPLPHLAPHLLVRHAGQGRAQGLERTTLDARMQQRATEVVVRHHQLLAQNGVFNAAALILDVTHDQPLAYVGNIPEFARAAHANHVDVVRAPRSTGSLLKPLLYAAMLDTGELLPHQLVADIPTSLGGFSPENFNRTYDGAVPAARALSRSLNVPTVRLLRDYGVDRFYSGLKRLGLSTLTRPAASYGLSLILGGAEGTLWDLTHAYAGLSRAAQGEEHSIGAGAAYLTLQALLEVNRPGAQSAWRAFGSARRIAWKTGTSYGFRDGWAIGVTPTHAVGVWVGNADGEGRPGLTGYRAAAPLLFDLFDLVEGGDWFAPPIDDLVAVEVCSRSGHRAGPRCRDTHVEQIPAAGLETSACPYCREIHCDAECRSRVHADCEPVQQIRREPWFVLPPAMEWYYVRRHAGYRQLPPLRPDCAVAAVAAGSPPISFIYPRDEAILFVPVELDGERGRAIFRAAHRDDAARLFWHLDDRFLAETRDLHQLALAPPPGDHVLTLVDDTGARAVRRFTVIDRER